MNTGSWIRKGVMEARDVEGRDDVGNGRSEEEWE